MTALKRVYNSFERNLKNVRPKFGRTLHGDPSLFLTNKYRNAVVFVKF